MAMMNQLTPMEGCLLVELSGQYGYVETPDKKYDSKTSGVVIRANVKDGEQWPGRIVYFEAYKDDVQINRDGTLYAFIKLEEVRGYEE